MQQLKIRQFEYEDLRTDVRETSIYAYHYIYDELSARQLEVFKVLKELGTANNKMLAEAIEKPINEITPRIHELRNMWRCKYCGHTRPYAHKKKPDSRGNRRCDSCFKKYNGFYVKYPMVVESHGATDLETGRPTIHWKIIEHQEKRF